MGCVGHRILRSVGVRETGTQRLVCGLGLMKSMARRNRTSAHARNAHGSTIGRRCSSPAPASALTVASRTAGPTWLRAAKRRPRSVPGAPPAGFAPTGFSDAGAPDDGDYSNCQVCGDNLRNAVMRPRRVCGPCCGRHPDPPRGRRLTENIPRIIRSSVVSPGAATTTYMRGSPLTRGRDSGRPSGSAHVGTGGTRGQHPPAPPSGFMREQRPVNRGAAVCVDCESNKEKVSQRLPHSGMGKLVDALGSVTESCPDSARGRAAYLQLPLPTSPSRLAVHTRVAWPSFGLLGPTSCYGFKSNLRPGSEDRAARPWLACRRHGR